MGRRTSGIVLSGIVLAAWTAWGSDGLGGGGLGRVQEDPSRRPDRLAGAAAAAGEGAEPEVLRPARAVDGPNETQPVRAAESRATVDEDPSGKRRPELVVLKELNSDDMESGPWVSADGLTIYWTVFYHRLGPVIWKAKRSGPAAAFEKSERLFSGAYPSLNADGRIMVLNRRGGLRITQRASVDQPFPRPADIAELQDEPYCRRACLSEDGLSLYFERLGGEPRGVELCVTRRRSDTSPWEVPKRLAFDRSQTRSPKISCPFVFRNGSALLCADYRKLGRGSSNFMLWTRSRPDGPFDQSRYLEFDGLTAFGLCPRYVEATHELFFTSDRTVSGRADDRGPDLYVIKNVWLPDDAK